MAWVRENFILSPIFCITYVIQEGLETQLHVMDRCEVTCVCVLVELGNLSLCSSHWGLIDPPWQDGVPVISARSLNFSLVT